MKKYLKEKELFNKIKKIVLKYYPILEDSTDDIYNELEININFLKDENGSDITKVGFMKGNDRIKISAFENLFIKGLITNYELSGLISFLIGHLGYYTWIDLNSDINEQHKRLSLSFDVDSDYVYYDKIILNLEVCDLSYSYPNSDKVIQNYLNFISEAFCNELKDSSRMKTRRELHDQNLKEEKIASFSIEDLKQFISLLNDEELRNIVNSMNNDRFLEVFNDFEEEKKNHQLVKK